MASNQHASKFQDIASGKICVDIVWLGWTNVHILGEKVLWATNTLVIPVYKWLSSYSAV